MRSNTLTRVSNNPGAVHETIKGTVSCLLKAFRPGSEYTTGTRSV